MVEAFSRGAHVCWRGLFWRLREEPSTFKQLLHTISELAADAPSAAFWIRRGQKVSYAEKASAEAAPILFRVNVSSDA